MYSDLKPKQRLILEFIKEQIATKGYPPSVRETCDAVGIKSTSTVHSNLNKLEKCGYIKRDATKPRAIEVLDKSKTSFNNAILNLPLISQVTAGQPILAKENIEEYIPLPSNFIKGNDSFVLKVKGDSMKNAGILNGDYVTVHRKNHSSNGDIVVALIYNEYATVKRFFDEENNNIRLQPENDFMDPIILNNKDVEVVGVVTGVFRTIK